MIKLDINTDMAIRFTATLERLHRSALPVAIREALNNAAFDVKQNTMPTSAKRSFKERKPNFFKANSRVEKATGFKIKSMLAKTGFKEQGLKGNTNFAVKDLEQQEEGGKIKGRSFIPTKIARGNNAMGLTKGKNKISNIKNIINGTANKQKFVMSVLQAGKDGHVLGEIKGKRILWRVNSLKKTKGGQFKITALYSFEKNRAVSVKGTRFMEKASLQSGKKIEGYYQGQAQKQIDRLKI